MKLKKLRDDKMAWGKLNTKYGSLARECSTLNSGLKDSIGLPVMLRDIWGTLQGMCRVKIVWTDMGVIEVKMEVTAKRKISDMWMGGKENVGYVMIMMNMGRDVTGMMWIIRDVMMMD